MEAELSLLPCIREGPETLCCALHLPGQQSLSLAPVRTAHKSSVPLLQESFLDEGFILDKKIGVGQPKRIENAKILVANTAMDTDKIKIYGARVRVDSMQKVSCLMGSLQPPHICGQL
jgi:hypothetical protein